MVRLCQYGNSRAKFAGKRLGVHRYSSIAERIERQAGRRAAAAHLLRFGEQGRKGRTCQTRWRPLCDLPALPRPAAHSKKSDLYSCMTSAAEMAAGMAHPQLSDSTVTVCALLPLAGCKRCTVCGNPRAPRRAFDPYALLLLMAACN